MCLNSHVYKYLYALARAWRAFLHVVVGVNLRARLLIAMLHLSVISRINGCGFGPGRECGAFPELGRKTLRATREHHRVGGRVAVVMVEKDKDVNED